MMGFFPEIPWSGYRWYWWLLPWRWSLAWRRLCCIRMLRNFGKKPYKFPKIKAEFPTMDINEVISIKPKDDDGSSNWWLGKRKE